ncbi:hypothetical protein GCM10023205_67410 [Yinghuangia aomiensis]|uniref:Amidohydrolase-related domain-containing protein n=1 Tax=Yinghuangia aomiensis TaxID=676205 RepID=A0ABP9I4T2_9ACTN
MSTYERLISADDHVDVGHETVKQFLASKFHDDYDAAVDRHRAGMASMASRETNERWREQQAPTEGEPSSGDEVSYSHPASGRVGHRDARARLADMDADGVDASVVFCEVSAFRYLYLLERGSREATRAFNMALREFASLAPERLAVSHQIPIHDIDAAVEEVSWAASEGGRSVQLPVYPAELGLPDYWDRRYDRLWAALEECGLPICCHTGLNTQLEGLARRDPTPQRGVYVPLVPLSAAEAMGMFVLTGVLERFPGLKVVFVEPGIAWVSWWLYTVDDLKLRQGYRFPGLRELPSHYFRRNVFLTFIDEPDALRHARERLGVGNIMWSSDYPHPVSSWPNSRACVDAQFANEPEDERRLVLAGNAERVFGL